MVTIIVSTDNNWLIGRQNGMPWHIPADLKHFKKTTFGAAVIMGRKTWQSLPKMLPGRLNIVLSHSEVYGALKASTLLDALSVTKFLPDTFIIGGAKVYEDALKQDIVDRILLSRIKGEFYGDTYFPYRLIEKWKPKLIETYAEFNLFEYKR